MRPRAFLFGLALLVAPPALAQEPQGEPPLTVPPPGVSLTGHWKLDPKLSDEPGDKVREAMKGLQSDRDRPRPPVYPGPGGIPGDRGEGEAPTGPGIDINTPGMTGPVGAGDPFERRGAAGSSPSQSRAAFEYVLDLPDTLTIAQRPSLILIQENDDEGRVRALRPDGVRVRSPDGRAESRTRWAQGLLHVETWHDDGVHVEEMFELAPDRSLLTVTVRVNDGGSVISLDRVFRPDRSGKN
jgi:hypothetical protein